jgi:uncharacterized protein YdeI (YjbR/CyaY-like superfamily)
MSVRDPRVDSLIETAAPFARPILRELRERVHAACPEVVETIKWRSASFEHHGMLCGMASFKEHCTFGFWKHDLVVGSDRKALEAMGSFGRITKLSDLPPKPKFSALVRKAVKLNEDGVKVVRTKHARKALPMHPDLAAALKKNKKARATFDAFSPSHQREYLEWIHDAKKDDTRAKRVAQAAEWLAQGKPRNWKYMPQGKS